jgi:hypothetical protein
MKIEGRVALAIVYFVHFQGQFVAPDAWPAGHLQAREGHCCFTAQVACGQQNTGKAQLQVRKRSMLSKATSWTVIYDAGSASAIAGLRHSDIWSSDDIMYVPVL